MFILFCITTIEAMQPQDTANASIAATNEESHKWDRKWELYWGELLTPEEIGSSALSPLLVPVPKSWKALAARGDSQVSPFGYGTYHTVLQVPEEDAGKNM